MKNLKMRKETHKVKESPSLFEFQLIFDFWPTNMIRKKENADAEMKVSELKNIVIMSFDSP